MLKPYAEFLSTPSIPDKIILHPSRESRQKPHSWSGACEETLRRTHRAWHRCRPEPGSTPHEVTGFMVIAIDGPAGAGKSTVSRMLARTLNYIYLDTGAMYRAVGWALRARHIDSEEPRQVAAVIGSLPLVFALENGELVISSDGRRLTDELRDPEITNMAALISQQPAVRDYLTAWQRRLAEAGNIVAEGRDMTTVVFPEAGVKVYLTADIATRAARRHREYREKGREVEFSQLFAQIRERDRADRQRTLAPLRPAPGALYLDTSHLEPADAVQRILDFMDIGATNTTS